VRVLVTGGAGFIGSHLVEAYLRAGHEVAVADNLSTGHRGQVPPEARFFEADVRRADAMEEVFALFRPQVVNHHAAQINVRRSVEDPLFDADVNINGLIVLANLAIRHAVSRLLFASSGGAVYGEQEVYPAGEDHPTFPLSPYGVSKLAGEKYLHYFGQVWGLNHVVLRYANVYGPRQDPEGEAGVVAIFYTRLLAGQQPVINGDGLQTRDYIYVGDVAALNLLLSDPAAPQGCFNVGTGRETTVNEIFRLVAGACRADAPEVHGSPKAGEQRRSAISSSRVTARTGWRPSVDLETGMNLTCAHYRGGTPA
jgi:UDP-glucose 4-epimerase